MILAFIEEDDFELKHIQKRFYQDLELDPAYDKIQGNSLRSNAIIDSTKGKQLYLRNLIKRGDYYVMGVVTSDRERAETFFESFSIKNPDYGEKFEVVKDTSLFFTTKTSVKPAKFVENSNNYFTGSRKPKSYGAFNKKTIYQNKNNEAIAVELNKSHDFLMFEHIDSVWALTQKNLCG